MRWGLCLLFYISLANTLQNYSASHAQFRPEDYFKQDKPKFADSEKQVMLFFKLAHSRMDEHDVKVLATSLLPSYMQLCVTVPDCDTMLREVFGAHQAEAQLEVDRMDKLQFVLGRVMRMRGRMANRFGMQRGHKKDRRFRKKILEA